MLKLIRDINKHDLKMVAILPNRNISHSLEVLDRISVSQLQVGENST